MKGISKIITLLMVITASSQGGTTISGTLGSQFKARDGTNIPSGALVLLVVDSGGLGFLDLADNGPIAPGTTAVSGKIISTNQLGITVGSTFGGDTIINTLAAGSSGSIVGLLPNIDVTAHTGKNFAVVWFSQNFAALSSGAWNGTFGMIRLADWTIPSDADGKVYTLSSTDAAGATSFFSTSVATTATQLGGGGFVTGFGAAGVTSNIVKAASLGVLLPPPMKIPPSPPSRFSVQ